MLSRGKPRQAMIIRSHDAYDWKLSDFLHTRSLISELNLASGGEYEIILLVQLTREETAHLTTSELKDAIKIQELKDNYVPTEFRDMAIFFNEDQMAELYPKVEDHSYMYQAFQPLQWLAKERPEFMYFWSVEQDLRYTGHNYELFHQAAEWSSQQPRKLLWERNEAFYIPAVHKSWQNFSGEVAAHIPSGGILGPNPPPDYKYQPMMPLPSPVPEDWGVGEEADVIVFLPMWNPVGSGWWATNRLHGFTDDKSVPRRTSVVTIGRYSRRLLMQVHKEQVEEGYWIQGEMAMPTAALHHGLKAVSVPNPQFFNQDIDHATVNRVFNGESGKPLSIGNPAVNFGGMQQKWQSLTYSYQNRLGLELYRWWLGKEVQGREHPVAWEEKMSGGLPCFPPMLLHPIKDL